MADLQSKPLIELNLDTREITITNNIKYIDIDKNIANIFLQIYREDNTGLKAYLTKEELDSFVGKMFLIKPVTNDFTEITGINTEEFKSDNGGGVLRFIIPTEYTNRNGIVKCEIHINKDNELLASDRFVYNVKQSLVTQFNNSLLEDSDFPILQQLILEIQKDSNIDDTRISKTTTYSSYKINSQIKENKNEIINSKNIFFAKNNEFIAHRGSSLYPENTILAINKCGEIGYKWVEIDVAITSDGKFVLCHDEVVDRIFANAMTGTLKNLTYDEIKDYDIKVGDCTEYPNEKIATFEECLKTAKKLDIGLFIHIEYIDISDVPQLIDLIKAHGMSDKCTISSYKMSLIQEVRKHNTDIPVSVFGGYSEDSINNVKNLKNSFMDISFEHADSKTKVDAYHNADMKVVVYTVNNYAKAKLLLENGVDMIITDKLLGGEN